MVPLTATNGFFGASAGTALEYDFSNIAWSDSGSGNFGISGGIDWYDDTLPPWVDAHAGITVTGDYSVGVGLTGVAHLDLGQMETALDLDTTNGVIDADGSTTAARIDTALFEITEHELTATGPDAAASFVELGLHYFLNVDAKIEGHADYKIYTSPFSDDITGNSSGTIFEGNLVDLDNTITLIPHTTLENLGGLDGNVLTVALGDYFEGTIDIPSFEYDDVEHVAVAGKPDQLVLHGESSPFATMEFALADYLGVLGSWGYETDIFSEYITAGIEAGIFDAKLVAEANLVQDVTTTADVGVTLTTSLGETIEGSMGDDFAFDTPEGEGSFTVTADYSLIETVDSIMSLKLGSFIDWKLLFGAASLSIPSISEKWEVEFSALDGRVDLGELLGLSISFELTHDVTTYTSDAGEETYTLHYENFVTAASGRDMVLTTHQVDAVGGAIANVITGNDLNNGLDGAAGDDTILGMGGNDSVKGAVGADSMDGGEGTDTLVYAASTAGVVVDLGANTASGGAAEGDTIANFEAIAGSSFNDSLTGSDADNALHGNDGDDTILGMGGKDIIGGGLGADHMDGGDGVDTLTYILSASGVTVDLSLGTGSGGDANGDMVVGFEVLIGSAFNDSLTGNELANTLMGGAGDDTILGLDGKDQIVGGAGGDAVNGGGGADWLKYSGSGAAVSVDLVTGLGSGGDAESDVLVSIERVFGSAFDDTISGTDRGNQFDGGRGNDILLGLGGVDKFIFSAGADTVDGGDGIDRMAFRDALASYVIVDNGGGSWTVSAGADIAVLTSVEQLTFEGIDYIA